MLSDANACPYCGDMLISLVDAGDAHRTASAIFDRRLDEIDDDELRRRLEWVRAVGTPGTEDIPPCPFPPEALPELIGTLMSMADINRYSHVVMDGSPVNLPLGMQRPALRAFGRELVATKARAAEPGRALGLLPSAALPEDLRWAAPNPRIADAVARYAAAVERATSGVISPEVRALVERELRSWAHELMPLSRSWADQAVAGLDGEDRAVAKLALILAKSPGQASEDLVTPLAGADPDRFVRILAWCSFTGARAYARFVAGVVADSPPTSRRTAAVGGGRRSGATP